MKLHLPHSLYKAVLTAISLCVLVPTTEASIMHQDATLITYTDFGQNEGRYSVGVTNALLQHIRTQEGGVAITYTGGQATYIMPHGMIDFGSAYHVATCAAISPAAVGTVAHNVTFNSTFTNKVYGIGNEHAVKYKGIECGRGYAGNWSNSTVFSHALRTTSDGDLSDHKVMRLSKIITDAPYAEVYDSASKGTNNLMYYHAGSGQQWVAPHTGTTNPNTLLNSSTKLIGGYNYVTGGIVSANWQWKTGSGTNKVIISTESFAAGGISKSDPLTWVSRPGDSGSPLYVWDEESQSYQYIASNRGELTSGAVGSCYVMDTSFDRQVIDSLSKKVDMSNNSTVYLYAASTAGETKSDGTYSTTLYYGTVTDTAGNTLTTYTGLKSELNTWKDLNPLKDTQNWYSYDESYVQQSNQDLFFTENLQFNATAAQNRIVLAETVDLGIGYAEFNGGKFTITSAEGSNHLFNHAGYVINKGAEVHLQLTNPADYLREWRKIGEGDLYIEGTGNNDVLLNLGGSGKTYLNREDGYAAYNVLANNGTSVIISDINQIKRDFTFGNRGGVLDMNSNSMDWYTTAEAADSDRDGFSINALTEDALIANTQGHSTLTYKESGATSYLGSFADTKDAALKIVYQGGGTWTLQSIRTNLQHADSGLQVDDGTVILRGSNTIHGTGSAGGTNENRYFHEDDWHYADAAMNVTVNNGGTFELGSHARLTGNVTVEQGGTYTMREGVRHLNEFVEGGQILEDTTKYSDFYGHKGDVILNGGTFAVQFNDGVDTATSYAGNVSGNGSMTVDTGITGGSLNFSGTVASGVSKTLNCGQLLLTGAAAEDTDNKWMVHSGGVMVQFADAADTLSVIDGASSGIIGLTEDCTTQLDFSNHSNLGVGALFGQTVQYGAAGTGERLTSLNLGGGGNLLVNFILSGTDTLNVNAGRQNSGSVTLQQVAADYAGTVNIGSDGGKIIVSAAQDGAFHAATVNINEGGVLKLTDTQQAVSGTVNVNTGGTLEGKNVAATGTVNLTGKLSYDNFTVRDGGKVVMKGGSFDSDNALTVAENGTLDLNASSFTQQVKLTEGGVVHAGGATIAGGANLVATQGTGKLSMNGGTVTINGHVGAAEGATLRLENGAVNFNVQNINTTGGTLELACSSVELAYRVNQSTQTIGGTLAIANNVTINVNQGNPGAYQGTTHNINHLHINPGNKLTLVESGNEFIHVYRIDSLTGSGSIVWQGNNRWFDSSVTGPSRLLLTGDNEFTGELLINQVDNHGSMQHVSLEHENAARNMVINMWGDSNSRPALAISTSTARVAGIGGTTDTFVYAGAVKTSRDGNDPGSTALNTLVIDTKGADHTYNGTLLGSATTGLNITKESAGTQTFTNSANVVHDITVQQGHLNFSAAPTVYGDVSIAQGAELTIGSGAFSLDEGHTLSVLGGSYGSSAVLNNELVLNGGSLNFCTYDTQAAALSTSGVSIGSEFSGSLSLTFSNQALIRDGVRYRLATGNWTTLDGKLAANNSGYLNSYLTADSTGLYATFSMKEGYTAWNGNTEILQEDSNVVFAGFGGVNEIALDTSATASSGWFDNADTFTVSSANGSSLTFERIEKSAGGDLVFNTEVNAQTMTVRSSALITGSGSLNVGTLTAESDMTTGMVVQATDIQGNGNRWTLDGSRQRLNQRLSVEQANTFSSITMTGDATLELAPASSVVLNTAVSGSGSVTKNGAGKLTVAGSLQLSTLQLNAGELEAQGAVDIDRMTVADGLTVTLYNAAANSGAQKKLGTVELGNAGILQTNDREAVTAATTIETLQLSGSSATVQDVHHSGNMAIHNLVGGTAATLNLVKNVTSNNVGIFTLGTSTGTTENGCQFGGTILLKQQNASWAGNQDVALLLGHASVAQNATINLASSSHTSQKVGLGINTASATIGGLDSVSALGDRAIVFSGTQASNAVWSDKSTATTRNTLTINTGSGVSRQFYGQFQNVNLVKDGAGTQTFSGSSSAFHGSLTVNGGKLVLGANALSMLTSASAVEVNEGGILDLKAAAITEGQTSNLLQPVSGKGTVVLGYTSSGNGTGFDFSGFGGNVQVDSGRVLLSSSVFAEDVAPDFTLTSSSAQLVFNGTGTTVNSNVHITAAETTIHTNTNCSGSITGSMTGNALVKEGGGTMSVNNINLTKLVTLTGRIELNGTGHTLGLLDGSRGSKAKGTLALTQLSELTVSGQLWGRKDSSVVLEQGATLNATEDAVVISNRGAAAEATLRTASSVNDAEYTTNSTSWELSHAHIQSTAAGNKTLSNKLVNSSVENAGSGKLTVNNADNSLTDVYATGGDLEVLQAATGLNLSELTLAQDKTVGLYTGADATTAEANVTVSKLAEFGKGARLNANLTLASGSTLRVAKDGLSMGSTLTLQQGITLDDSTLNRAHALQMGESLALFTGVDGLTLGNTSYSVITEEDNILAAPYFSNLDSNNYVLTYTGTDNGTLNITMLSMTVPEPTTATLSLLALTALAARRRRRL